MELSYESYDVLVSRSKYVQSYHSYMSSRFNKNESELDINNCLPEDFFSPDTFLPDLFYLVTVEDLDIARLNRFICHYKTAESMPIITILRKIFAISDFFQIDILFNMLFQIYVIDQVQRSPDLLVGLLNYDKDHPRAKYVLEYLSVYFGLTREQILDLVTFEKVFSTKRLKSKIRSILRHTVYFNKFSNTICSVCMCKGVYLQVGHMEFKFMSLTPCCGSLIHDTCISTFNSLYTCAECTTVLYKGQVDTELETFHHLCKRLDKRKQNNISRGCVLPLLTPP